MGSKTETARPISKAYAVYGWSRCAGRYAFAAVYNEFAVRGVECLGVEADIVLPADAGLFPVKNLFVLPARAWCAKGLGSERGVLSGSAADAGISRAERVTAGRLLHEAGQELRKICEQRGVELTDVRARQNPLYTVPCVTVTGIGEEKREEPEGADSRIVVTEKDVVKEKKEIPGIIEGEVVVTKWIGMEGMLRIAQEREEELRQRFAPVFLRQIQSREDEIFAGEECKAARQAGAFAVRQITEGGIFAALWEMSKETGMGLDLDMKRIPILQETIEVCECYRMNPYRLASAGCFLMAAPDGKRLTDALHEKGILASVIGRLTAGKDKIIRNGEDIRCLDRPAPDEIYRLFEVPVS